jgi:hypothetical protein
MSGRDDRMIVVEAGTAGDAVIFGFLIAALILLGLFFLFGDQIYSGGAKKIDVDVNLPKVEAPAKQ